jgi:hypothetical protein
MPFYNGSPEIPKISKGTCGMFTWKWVEVLPCDWKIDGDAEKCAALGQVATLLCL